MSNLLTGLSGFVSISKHDYVDFYLKIKQPDFFF